MSVFAGKHRLETCIVSNGENPREPTVDRGTNGERELANELEGRSGAVENAENGERERGGELVIERTSDQPNEQENCEWVGK